MRSVAASVVAALLAVPAPASPPPEAPSAIVLGIAQDGGFPQAGCREAACAEARRDRSRRRFVASLGLLDPAAGKRFQIDATPDFADQMELLGGLPDAILLTHAHIGHYLGLAQLGREVLNTHRLPVYATPSMARFLRQNGPWKRLVTLENIEIREIEIGKRFELTAALSATAIPVPHRDEDSDTVAYLVTGPRSKILWLPDIDKWEKWDRKIEDFLADESLYALVDGTFFAADEIPGRSIVDIPHPLVPETMSRFGNNPPRGRLFFVHLNHTNRLLWDREALAQLRKKGFDVAAQGMRLTFD